MNNNRSIIANSVLAIFFLMNSVHVFGMEKESDLVFIAADEHNKKFLPRDVWNQIILGTDEQKQTLNGFIQTTLSLKNSCKHFNASLSLDWLKEASKEYSQEEKDRVMKELLCSMNDLTYWKADNRRKAIMLTYSGANNQVDVYYSLLKRAIHRKDKIMIAVLFQNNAHPNQQGSYGEPDFFHITTVDMLEMFIAQGLDVNTEDYYFPNVLWWSFTQHFFPVLIEKYLEAKVDVRKKNSNGCCMLHQLVYRSDSIGMNLENYIKIGELLCNAAPDMINVQNNDRETPLQLLHKMSSKNLFKHEKENLLALIPVFEKCERMYNEQLKTKEMKY